jgi:uncharacterized lipoprotein YddW (UPF0748 family)
VGVSRLIVLFISVCAAVFLCGCELDDYYGIEGDNLRGAWVATVYGIDFPRSATANDSSLRAELNEIVDKACQMKLNTLFFQVRPCADAFYNSRIFPWSKFLTGVKGRAPGNDFDPLEYAVQKCHEHGIKIHAWINPYRVTVSATDTADSGWPLISVGGRYYFNPAEPQAMQLIIDGVREIVENYAVDGIHFDDYFYPQGLTDEDASAWLEHGSGFVDIADWRRNNVDELVRRTRDAVKEVNPLVVFGISPSGIWANKSGNSLGSDTRGFESYNEIYADSRGWVKKGYVDYIAPQIYWRIGQTGSDFFEIINWWNEVCEGTGVKLYPGIASYKNFEQEEYDEQIFLANELGNGFIAFSFGDLTF